MKKYAFLFIILTLMSFLNPSMSRNITPEEARIAAQGKLNRLTGSLIEINSLQPFEVKDGTTVLAYFFHLEPEGFIVVSGMTELPPVIAYSNLGKIDFGSTESSQFFGFLLYDMKLRYVNSAKVPGEIIGNREKEWQILLGGDENKTGKIFQQWPPEGTTPTGGWLESNWTQDSPYNDMCPVDPVTLQRSVAGCPATAMAMIVNYYKTINNSSLSDDDDYYHSYAGRNYWIDNDYLANGFPCFPDLNVYLDSLESRWSSGQPLKPEHKAAITFACGVAAKQVYTSSGSGTFGVNQAYNAYIRFGFNECSLIDESDTAIYTKLAVNMMDARPAHLAIVTPAWDMGHNVVVDGYNTDNYFHINFGWGGPYNSWYLLPEEIPYGLTVIEGLIIDIYDPVFTGMPGYTSLENDMVIYPNPAGRNVNICFTLTAASNIKIELIEPQSGNCILQSGYRGETGYNHMVFDLGCSYEENRNHIFLIRLSYEGYAETRKILVR